MTLQQLKYMIIVAERGSITEAAKELYISQPSLSGAILCFVLAGLEVKVLPLTGMILLTLISILNSVCVYPVRKHKNQLQEHFNTIYSVC